MGSWAYTFMSRGKQDIIVKAQCSQFKFRACFSKIKPPKSRNTTFLVELVNIYCWDRAIIFNDPVGG
jgi:hypothetical protein